MLEHFEDKDKLVLKKKDKEIKLNLNFLNLIFDP
jgi:hypothetical protein